MNDIFTISVLFCTSRDKWFYIVQKVKPDQEISDGEIIKGQDDFATESDARTAGFKWCKDNDIKLTLK